MELDAPIETGPKDRLVVLPAVRLAGESPVPVQLTEPLPDGPAEKLIQPPLVPLALGVNTTRTTHDAPGTNVVTSDTQSSVAPV
jgi:hypothetical protein